MSGKQFGMTRDQARMSHHITAGTLRAGNAVCKCRAWSSFSKVTRTQHLAEVRLACIRFAKIASQEHEKE